MELEEELICHLMIEVLPILELQKISLVNEEIGKIYYNSVIRDKQSAEYVVEQHNTPVN